MALTPEDRDSPLRLVDIGSGGGLPGMAIAIAYPRWSITLLDSVGKKAGFLESTANRMDLPKVEVVCDRAENFGRSAARDSYDIACARAVATFPVLIEYCAPLVRKGGRIILFKSGDVPGEVARAEHVLEELNCRLTSVIDVPAALPVGEDHRLVILQKIGATPEKYPRRVGLARSRPL
jgi:16S rRNA (guanine527-N7)-methyltransferase